MTLEEIQSMWKVDSVIDQIDLDKASLNTPSLHAKYLELLKIRREVLAEKREAEAQARRAAIQRQELMITMVGIIVLLLFTFVGATGYLHYMGWIDVRDYFP